MLENNINRKRYHDDLVAFSTEAAIHNYLYPNQNHPYNFMY